MNASHILGIIMGNFEEIPYEGMEIRLRLRANTVNPGPFAVYVHQNATPQTLQ